MTPEKIAQMNELCKRIQIETDPVIFDQLVSELSDLLEVKHERLHPENQGKHRSKVSDA